MTAFNREKSDNLVFRKMAYTAPAILSFFIMMIVFGLYQTRAYEMLFFYPVIFLFEIGRGKSRKTEKDKGRSFLSDLRSFHGVLSLFMIFIMIILLLSFDIGQEGFVNILLLWLVTYTLRKQLERGVIAYLKSQAEHSLNKIQENDFSFLSVNDGILRINDGIQIKRKDNEELMVILNSKAYNASGFFEIFVNNIVAEKMVKDQINEKRSQLKNMEIKFV